MIYRKSWFRFLESHTYLYEGWFLLGILPIYITRRHV